MNYAYLGQTGLFVSKICFGALTLGPLQANLGIERGVEVIKTALDVGINFIDTAELYQNYEYIRKALKGDGREVNVSTKSYAYSRELMAQSLEKARREMDRDQIEIFLLHEQESLLTIKGHWEALEYLLNAKEKGIVRAVGISTHAVAAVHAAADIEEIDVIHPMLNMRGLGILDGNVDEMLQAVRKAEQAGKGIYSMKSIGGGNLIGEVKEALNWSFRLDCIHSVAIGMKSPEEVRINAAWADSQEPNKKDLEKVSKGSRKLHIDEWCQGCGQCVSACPQNALKIMDGKAVVDQKNCVFCGYCGSACRDFYIKVI